jgi:hypothetical protein
LICPRQRRWQISAKGTRTASIQIANGVGACGDELLQPYET